MVVFCICHGVTINSVFIIAFPGNINTKRESIGIVVSLKKLDQQCIFKTIFSVKIYIFKRNLSIKTTFFICNNSVKTLIAFKKKKKEAILTFISQSSLNTCWPSVTTCPNSYIWGKFKQLSKTVMEHKTIHKTGKYI